MSRNKSCIKIVVMTLRGQKLGINYSLMSTKNKPFLYISYESMMKMELPNNKYQHFIYI